MKRIYFLCLCAAITSICSYAGPFKLSNSGCSVYWPFDNSALTSCPAVGNSTGTNGWNVTCGPGCGGHVNGDQYADDWVRQDQAYNNISMSENFRSPISGTVIVASWFNSGNSCNLNNVCSYGRQVVIRSNQNQEFVFRVTHLNSINVSVGTVVNVGHILGTIGNSSCCNMIAHAHCVMYKGITNSIVTTYLENGATPPSSCAVPWCFDATNTSTPVCQSNKFVTGNISSGVHHYYAGDYIYLHDAWVPSNATCYFHCKALRGYGSLKIEGNIQTFNDPCTIGQSEPLAKFGSLADPDTFSSEVHLDEIELYPNPMNNEFNIKSNIIEDDRELYLKIFDVTGRKMIHNKMQFKDNIYKVDVSNWNNGFYIVILSDMNGSTIINKKILKN